MTEIILFNEIFNQIQWNFRFMGIPLSKQKLCLRFYVLVSCITITLIQEILFFFSKFSHENFLDLTQLAPCISVGFLSIMKIVFISMKRNSIADLTNSLRSLYNDALKDNNKRTLVNKDFIFLKFLIKYFFLLNAILICVYNFSTFIFLFYYYCVRKEFVFRLPYAVSVPFSTDVWYNWVLVYVHSITSGFICVLFYTTVDALYFILTTHTCSQLSLLSNEIKQLDDKTSSQLNGIIKKHQYILKLAKNLDDIFEGPNLFNFLVGSLEICALGFNLTMGPWAQIPGVVLFLLSVLLQILMISVFGENLILESKKIGEAAFLCKWYIMDRTSKRNIVMLIIRSHRACVLTAYKYSIISYQSFTKIISTSWSYFTILKTVYSPDNLEIQNE